MGITYHPDITTEEWVRLNGSRIPFASTVVLSPPDNPVATGGIGEITLTADTVPGADSYRWYRSTSIDGVFSSIITGLASPAYTDTDVTAGATYYYRPTAFFNASGNSGFGEITSATVQQEQVGTARFPGDPGVGNTIIGNSTRFNSIETHEAEMGAPLGMIRMYSSNLDPPWNQADEAIAAGCIPAMSFRTNNPDMFSRIADGLEDAWIVGIANQMKARAPWPIWWTLNHEPNNDWYTGSTRNPSTGEPANPTYAAYYRGAQRRIKLVLRSEGVTNDTFVANYLIAPYGFRPWQNGGWDWRWMYPDWKDETGVGTDMDPDPNDFYLAGDPDSVVDVFGFDVYHQWSLNQPVSEYFLRTGTGLFAEFDPIVSFLGKPYAVGEYATMLSQDNVNLDPNNNGWLSESEYNAQIDTINYYPQDTRDWLEDYYSLREIGVVAMMWWDSDLQTEIEPGVYVWDVSSTNRLDQDDPNGVRWQKLGELANRETSKTPFDMGYGADPDSTFFFDDVEVTASDVGVTSQGQPYYDDVSVDSGDQVVSLNADALGPYVED